MVCATVAVCLSLVSFANNSLVPLAHLFELGFMQGENSEAHLMWLADIASKAIYETLTDKKFQPDQPSNETIVNPNKPEFNMNNINKYPTEVEPWLYINDLNRLYDEKLKANDWTIVNDIRSRDQEIKKWKITTQEQKNKITNLQQELSEKTKLFAEKENEYIIRISALTEQVSQIQAGINILGQNPEQIKNDLSNRLNQNIQKVSGLPVDSKGFLPFVTDRVKKLFSTRLWVTIGGPYLVERLGASNVELALTIVVLGIAYIFSEALIKYNAKKG